MTRQHILAKKNLNAEIKQQARIGHTDHIMPSEIHARDRLAGLGAMNDEVMKTHILAKKEVNAEIKEQGMMGHTDHILPSEIAAHEKQMEAKHDRLKGEMQYEQAKDETHATETPKDVATPEVTEEHHLSTSQKIKEKVKDAAHAVKETLKNLH